MIIKVEKDGKKIMIIGDMDAEQALEAYGYDRNVEYSVEK